MACLSSGPLNPLIAIVGTTGTSKSRLAIDLASQCLAQRETSFLSPWRGSKVINGDAMQVYRGLDVITNKVSKDEQHGIQHLLLGFRAPGEQYIVTDWLTDARAAIDAMHRNLEVPIVVGGTAYWIQNLIFASRLASEKNSKQDDNSTHASIGTNEGDAGVETEELQRAISLLPSELTELWQSLPSTVPRSSQNPDLALSLHRLLAALDPTTAARWHWKDARRVLTSLRIIREHRMRASDVLMRQSERPSARYNTLLLWLYTDPETLHSRLDSRVDQMIERGLLDEIKQLRAIARQKDGNEPTQIEEGDETSYETGIYQAIGYKEFERYLSLADPPAEVFRTAVEDMKRSTRQYARRQMKWLRNKLQPMVRDTEVTDNVKLYVLEVNESDTWEKGVKEPAVQLMHDFLDGNELPLDSALTEGARKALSSSLESFGTSPAAILQDRKKIVCNICTRDPNRPVMIEEGLELSLHQRSRSHRKGVKRKARQQESENAPQVELSQEVTNPA